MKRRRLTKTSDEPPAKKTARRTSAAAATSSSGTIRSQRLSQRSSSTSHSRSPSPAPGKRPVDSSPRRTTRRSLGSQLSSQSQRKNKGSRSQSSRRAFSEEDSEEIAESENPGDDDDEKENVYDGHLDDDVAVGNDLRRMGRLVGSIRSDEDEEITGDTERRANHTQTGAVMRGDIETHTSSLVNYLLGKQARGEVVRMSDINKFKMSSRKGSGKKNLEAADAVLQDVFGIKLKLFSRKSEASNNSQEPKKHNVADDLYVLEFSHLERSERLKNLAQELLLPQPQSNSAFNLGVLGIVLAVLHLKSGSCEESFLREKLENMGLNVDDKVWELISKVFVKQLYLVKIQNGESKITFKKGPRAEEIISPDQLRKFMEEITSN